MQSGKVQSFPWDHMCVQLRQSTSEGVLPHRIGEPGMESLYDSLRPIDIKRSFGAEHSQVIDSVDMVGMTVGVHHSVEVGHTGSDHLKANSGPVSTT